MDVFKNLKLKETVVRIDDFTQPYLAEIKHFESVHVSDEELEEYRKISLERLGPSRYLPAPTWTRGDSPEKKTPSLSAYKDILDYLIKNPDANQTKIKNDLGFSQWEFTKHTDAMKKREYIREHVISLGKKGSPATYFEVLKPGFDYLCRPHRPLAGKGNYPHRLFQFLIAKQVSGVIELRGADVGWEKPNGEKIAIEVEMAPHQRENILNNVKRDIGTGFSEVWIVCKNENEKEKIKYVLDTWLDDEDREKTEIKLFRELL
jgi:hypothetical protein